MRSGRFIIPPRKCPSIPRTALRARAGMRKGRGKLLQSSCDRGTCANCFETATGAPPGLAEGAPALRRELLRAEETRARPRPAHRVRERALSEYRGVLASSHGHLHDPGESLHAHVRVLHGSERETAAARLGG